MSIKILYGAHQFGTRPPGGDKKYLDLLTEHGVKDIDTAYIYVSSECHLLEIGKTLELA